MLLMKKKKMQILLITAICILSLAIIIHQDIEHYTKKNEKNQKYEAYVVQQGDTLWSIAKKYTNGDPRELIYKIRKHNDISPMIYPGQVIEIPVVDRNVD